MEPGLTGGVKEVHPGAPMAPQLPHPALSQVPMRQGSHAQSPRGLCFPYFAVLSFSPWCTSEPIWTLSEQPSTPSVSHGALVAAESPKHPGHSKQGSRKRRPAARVFCQPECIRGWHGPLQPGRQEAQGSVTHAASSLGTADRQNKGSMHFPCMWIPSTKLAPPILPGVTPDHCRVWSQNQTKEKKRKAHVVGLCRWSIKGCCLQSSESLF